MYCSLCGAQNPDGSEVTFCRACGTALAVQPAEPMPVAGGEAEVALDGPIDAAYVGRAGMDAVFPYGGFWIRLLAYFIDGLILGAVTMVLVLVVTLALIVGRGQTNPEVWAVQLAFLLVQAGYYVVLPPFLGATPGKTMLGYAIVDGDLRHIGFGRAFVRYLGLMVSGLALCLGFAWIGFDRYKQGWHDKIAGTYVVRKEFVRF